MAYDPRALGAECHRCPLKHQTPVPPSRAKGDKPRLIIVGEGPGRLEENRGEVFIGPSGRLLNGALREAGFDRENAHVTNATMCRPESDQDAKAATPCCAPRLAKELGEFPLEVPVLALGAPATRSIIGKAGILKARGFIWHAPEIRDQQLRSAVLKVKKARKTSKSPTRAKRLTSALDSSALIHARATFAGRVVIPSVHPAFILRGADGWLPVMRVDIRRAVRWAEKPFDLEDVGPYRQTSSPAEARRLLRKLSKFVNVDIETDGRDPLTVGITCIGIHDVDRPENPSIILDPWENSLIPVLRSFLKDRKVLTHNGPAFDQIALDRIGIRWKKTEDTLIAHFAFASHLPKSLAHVGSVYCDAGPWKQKFKQGSEEKGVAGFGVKKEDLAAYNAADVRIGTLSWLRMQKDLDPERHVYEHDMRTAILCQKMQVNGILVDQARRNELSKKMKFRAAALLGEMRALLGRRSFHPARVADIRKALFKQLKAPTYLAPPTPTGLPAANAAVLEKLKTGSNRAAHLADLIIRWRSANDVRKEYLENLFLGNDGRVHPSWRNYGTVTGRPATRDPNALNTPRMQYCPGCGSTLIDGMEHKPTCKPKKRKEPQPEEQVRDIYIAAPGCSFVYFDLSQAEMRFAANVSGDENFIKSCKGDVHAGNAKIIFAGIPGAVEALTNDPKGAGKKFRDIAKNCGFAISYLAEAEKLFFHLIEHEFEVDLAVCQDIINQIHAAYWRYYQFVEENVQLCRKQGFLRSPFLGRKRWLGFYPKPTEVANHPIQSGVADVMNERLVVIDERMPRGVKQIVYAYDAAIYETPEGLVDEMKGLITDVWKPLVVVPGGREFPQPIDLKVGARWSDFG
jgi:uracil-DNA glycosylase family 4